MQQSHFWLDCIWKSDCSGNSRCVRSPFEWAPSSRPIQQPRTRTIRSRRRTRRESARTRTSWKRNSDEINEGGEDSTSAWLFALSSCCLFFSLFLPHTVLRYLAAAAAAAAAAPAASVAVVVVAEGLTFFLLSLVLEDRHKYFSSTLFLLLPFFLCPISPPQQKSSLLQEAWRSSRSRNRWQMFSLHIRHFALERLLRLDRARPLLARRRRTWHWTWRRRTERPDGWSSGGGGGGDASSGMHNGSRERERSTNKQSSSFCQTKKGNTTVFHIWEKCQTEYILLMISLCVNERLLFHREQGKQLQDEEKLASPASPTAPAAPAAPSATRSLTPTHGRSTWNKIKKKRPAALARALPAPRQLSTASRAALSPWARGQWNMDRGVRIQRATVCLSVCQKVGAPAAGPIVPELGHHTLLFTRHPIMGLKVHFKAVSRPKSRPKVESTA